MGSDWSELGRRMGEWEGKETKSLCQKLGQIRKSHSCVSHKDPELKLLNLLGQKSQVQIKEGRVRELAGLYTQEGWKNVHVPSQLRKVQRSRGHSVPPSQLARLGLQVLILA